MSAEQKLKILIADDEPDARDLLAYLLRSAGFDTCEAKDGLSAIQTAQDQHPALILLDVMMPDLDGLAVCEILKRQEATADIPVIFLSACGSQPIQSHGLKAGALAYVSKPFIWRELAAKICDALHLPNLVAA